MQKKYTPFFQILSCFFLLISCNQDDDGTREIDTSQPIYIIENGITIRANEDANVGDEYELNGEVYTVVDNQLLRTMLADGADMRKVITTKVTDLENLFSNKTGFNDDISSWDVHNVRNMTGLFHNATQFNRDISNWDVQNVSLMKKIFNGAAAFNQPIGKWNMKNVEITNTMFMGAVNFDQDLSNWDLEKVLSMRKMFLGAVRFNQNISSWNVSNVEDMSLMFSNAVLFNQDLSHWNTNAVTNFSDFDLGASSWVASYKPKFE